MKTRLHKKQQNCNKLLTLFSMSIALLSGVVAMGISTIRESYHQARAVEYDDENYNIFLIGDELSYTYSYFSNYLVTYDTSLFALVSSDTECTIAWGDLGESEYYFTSSTPIDDFDGFDSIVISSELYFYFDNNVSKFFIYDSNSSVYLPVYSLDLYFDSDYYSDVKQTIEHDIAANQPNPSQPMLDFVSIIVSGIGAFASGVASGISDFASALFLDIEGGQVVGLSVFGGILAIFAGLALAVGITIKVYNWITTLGN